MEALNRIWIWLDNKKSAIGSVAGTLLTWAMVRGYLAQDTAEMLAMCLTVWTAVSVGHKIQKSQQ